MDLLRQTRHSLGDFYFSLSIKWKIIIVFSLIFILLFFPMAFITYQLSSRALIKKAIENSLQNLELVAEKFDIVFANTQNYANIAITNNEIQQVLTHPWPAETIQGYRNYLGAQRILRNIITPQTYIDAILIYTVKGAVFDSGDLDRVAGFDQTAIRVFFTHPGVTRWEEFHRSRYRKREHSTAKYQNVVSLLGQIRSEDTGEPLGIIEVCISERYISSLYTNINLGRNGAIFIVNRSGRIISAGDKTLLNQSIRGKPYAGWLSGSSGGKIFRIGRRECLVFNRKYEKIGWTIVGLVPIREITKDNQALTGQVLLLGTICILLAILLSVGMSVSITKPLIQLKESMMNVGRGDLQTRLHLDHKDEIGMLAEEFNTMIHKTAALMEGVYEEQKKKRAYELALLQAQINPHFLYNTLESICGLASLHQSDEVIALVNDLALFYRGVLSKGSNLIAIEDEIGIAERYLKILKVRLGDRFDYEIDIDSQIYHCATVKLLLQPLVENSIHHGFKKKRGKGLIRITGRAEGELVILEVRDDGTGIDPDKAAALLAGTGRSDDYKNRSFGLKITDERIKMYFGPDYGLTIESAAGQGTAVKALLPRRALDEVGQ